jgi:hypothetical protein
LAALPVPGLEKVHDQASLADLDLGGPVLTVAILAARGDEAEAASALAALGRGDLPVPTQVLLVTTQSGAPCPHDASGDLDVVRAPPGSSPGAMGNAALKAARGDYVAFLTVPAPLDASALGALVTAHTRGHALVGGTLLDTTGTPAGWAGSLLDRPADSGEPYLLPTTAYVSFAREALRGIGGFEEGTAAPEALAARRLLRSGFSGTLLSELQLVPCQPPSALALLRHRFRLGRAMIAADRRSSSRAPVGRIAGATLRQAAARTHELATVADQGAGTRLAVIGLVWAGGAATWIGAACEALAGRRRPEQALP